MDQVSRAPRHPNIYSCGRLCGLLRRCARFRRRCEGHGRDQGKKSNAQCRSAREREVGLALPFDCASRTAPARRTSICWLRRHTRISALTRRQRAAMSRSSSTSLAPRHPRRIGQRSEGGRMRTVRRLMVAATLLSLSVSAEAQSIAALPGENLSCSSSVRRCPSPARQSRS